MFNSSNSNLSYGNTEASHLISQGFHKISQEKYLERAKDSNYITNVFTTYLLKAGDEFIAIDPSTYEEYKAYQPGSVKIEQSFYSRIKTALPINAPKVSQVQSQVLKPMFFEASQKPSEDAEKETSTNDSSPIESLPNEVLSQIFNYIQAVKRQKLKEVSKRFNELVKADASIGTLRGLPKEIVSQIMNLLSPFERNKIKTVSTGINRVASEENLNLEAREMALRNLELIRPYIANGFVASCETLSSTIPTIFYFDQEGQVVACSGDNSNIFYKDKDSGLLVESQKTEDPELENYPALWLDWNRRKSKRSKDNNVSFMKSRRLSNFSLKAPTGFAKSVAEEMILMANQLWEGSHQLAEKDKLRRFLTPGWIIALENPSEYPTSVILEAAKK